VGEAPSTSHELRAYPKDLLSSPLDVTAVRTRLVPETVPETRPHVTGGPSLQAPDRVADSGFAALVGRERLSFWVILASLGIALFWGAAHALSPGHGKTIVTAYLVGQRGTARHAALLGLTVAFSVGLAAAMTSIGLLAVTAKRAFSRLDLEAGAVRLLPAVSALVIVGLGLAMTVRALPKIV